MVSSWLRAGLLATALTLVGVAAGQSPIDSPAPRPSVEIASTLWDGPDGRARVFDALVDLFAREYWDAAHRDWPAWGAVYREEALEAAERAAFDAVLTRMVRSLADEHSTWIGRPFPNAGQPLEPDLPASATPRLGVQLAYVEDRGLVVERVYAGTPADRAGLRRADVITRIGEVDVRRAGSLFEANGVLADALAVGRTVLHVERGAVARTVEVAGAVIAFERVAARPYATMIDDTVGYLHVPTFNEDGVAHDVHAALRELATSGARALILDLRGNLGGRLLEAGLTLGAFIDGTWAVASVRGERAWRAVYAVERGPEGAPRGVARLERADGGVLSELRLRDPVRFEGPMVVVVGAENASAAEVVAGALAESGRAKVVGERTAGNVEAVRAFELPDGSRVLIAIANLATGAEASLDGGVVPDVEARSTVRELARGVDPPVAEARRLLGELPFVPGRFF
jgi:carboxyl-terminal processing protease